MVLEKKVNETQISKTVFSHLKLCIYNNVTVMTHHAFVSFSAVQIHVHDISDSHL